MRGSQHRASRVLAVVVGLAALGTTPGRAEPIKIGVVTVAAFAPVFIAQEKGYFAAEGIPAEIVPFDAAQPVAVGVTAGSIDFGVSAVTGGLYNLAGQGALQIIGAAAAEHPGFHNQAILASKRADAAGLKLVKQLPGHSVAVTGVGARRSTSSAASRTNTASTSRASSCIRCNRSPTSSLRWSVAARTRPSAL